MSKVQWQELVAPTASLHIIIASQQEGDDAGPGGARGLQRLVHRLLKSLSLVGRYAVTISRAQQRLEIICAFELLADAELVSRGVNATAAPAPAGWASLQNFVLNESAMARVLAIAGPGRPRQPRAARIEE